MLSIRSSHATRWLCIAIAVVAACLAIQTIVSGISFMRANTQVSARLQAVVTRYQELGSEKLAPLLALNMSVDEHSQLESIAASVRALPQNGTAATTAITQLQRALWDFFTRQDVSTDLGASRDFAELKKEISGYGQVSLTLKEYNQAAESYAVAKRTAIGKILSALLRIDDPVLLYPDGKTRETKLFL